MASSWGDAQLPTASRRSHVPSSRVRFPCRPAKLLRTTLSYLRCICQVVAGMADRKARFADKGLPNFRPAATSYNEQHPW